MDAYWTQPLDNLSDKELWFLFEEALQRREWYLSMSDDSNDIKREADQYNLITRLYYKLNLTDSDRVLRLYAEACPWLNA